MLALLGFVLNFDYYARKFGVSTSHSSRIARRVITAEIAALFPKDTPLVITDPGCGSGGLIRHLARAFPRSEVTGLELSPIPCRAGQIKLRLFGPGNARILQNDFFAYDLSKSDVVVTFLPAPILERLEPKFRKELKPGAILLSNAFRMPEGWIPFKEVPLEKLLKRRLYCYRVS